MKWRTVTLKMLKDRLVKDGFEQKAILSKKHSLLRHSKRKRVLSLLRRMSPAMKVLLSCLWAIDRVQSASGKVMRSMRADAHRPLWNCAVRIEEEGARQITDSRHSHWLSKRDGNRPKWALGRMYILRSDGGDGRLF